MHEAKTGPDARIPLASVIRALRGELGEAVRAQTDEESASR